MGLAQKDTKRFCYGDYLTWPDGNRFELIDGTTFNMAPAPDLPIRILLVKCSGKSQTHWRASPAAP